jgi:proline racemase
VLSPDDWSPPEDWTAIETLDSHAGGEPLRIVTGGLPPVGGETILEKRRCFERELDHLRTGLCWEPRGHADMYAAVPVGPPTDDADLGVLFLHNDGYSTMCGHGIVALVTAAVETGALAVDPADPVVRIDTPAGRVAARPSLDRSPAGDEDGSPAGDEDGSPAGDENGSPAGDHPRVTDVTFQNVPSYVHASGRELSVPGYGPVVCDVAFGGAYYAYVDADAVGVELAPASVDDTVAAARAIERAVDDAVEIDHPTDDDLGFLYGVILSGPPRGDADLRNVCVFADGEVDRCPTGTGVSGHLARRHAAGDLAPNEPLVVESVVGSTFTGRIVETVPFAGREAVVPAVTGSASVTGRGELLFDPTDPFREGFLPR